MKVAKVPKEARLTMLEAPFFFHGRLSISIYFLICFFFKIANQKSRQKMQYFLLLTLKPSPACAHDRDKSSQYIYHIQPFLSFWCLWRGHPSIITSVCSDTIQYQYNTGSATQCTYGWWVAIQAGSVHVVLVMNPDNARGLTLLICQLVILSVVDMR